MVYAGRGSGLHTYLAPPQISRLAQLAEGKTVILVVVGASPTAGVLLCFFGLYFFLTELHNWQANLPMDQLLWRSWQRVGLIIPRSPVRSWSGAYASIAQSGRACA